MARICCLAGIEEDKVAMFGTVFRDAGATEPTTLARLNVSELGRARPDVVVCDVDGLTVDREEMVRQIRFVLPDAILAVYTGIAEPGWSVACHNAGANALFSKDATTAELSAGMREALEMGCFTDPRFLSAVVLP